MPRLLRHLLRTSAPLLAAVALAIVAPLALAGCTAGGEEAPRVASLGTVGGGTDDAAAGADREEELSTEQALIELTTCLRKEGLDVPDPKVASDGNLQILFGQDVDIDPDSAQAQAAFDTCRKYIQGILQSFSPEDITTLRDTLVDYAKCMRSNGYDLPDPNFFDRRGPFGDIDVKDPKFKQADAACRPVLERIQEVIG